MPKQKLAVVYFSGTQVTQTVAQVIATEMERLNAAVTQFDVTPYAARQEPFPIADFDAFLFGFPVYADFAPSVINEWLPTLQGGAKSCGMFCTYGARTSGYAHFHTKILLEQANFRVLFSAEFLGRHTFNVGGWNILPERPDETDFAIAREYAALALERFMSKTSPVFDLQKPFGYTQRNAARENQTKRAERGWTNPTRTTKDCSMCRDCETECPTQAFNADTGLSNPADCIECQRCLYICPDQVIAIDERMAGTYEGFKQNWHLTEEMMVAKQSKIFTEARQAAS
jgi:ferredoxin/flavodoxin